MDLTYRWDTASADFMKDPRSQQLELDIFLIEEKNVLKFIALFHGEVMASGLADVMDVLYKVTQVLGHLLECCQLRRKVEKWSQCLSSRNPRSGLHCSVRSCLQASTPSSPSPVWL